jgi:glycerophosphoryl diester phosphodiesterase
VGYQIIADNLYQMISINMKWLLCLPLVGLLCWHEDFKPNTVPKPRHKFVVICHRGDHVAYPENTLAADEQAIKDGADYIEIDLRTTKDGQLISMHDATVTRMTDGTGLVKDLTFDEIKKLKVSVKSQPESTQYPIPTFEQILKLCKNKIYIYIDFKEADPAVVYTMLKRYSMEKQVLIYINKPQQFIDWRRVASQMPLMVSMPDGVKDNAAMADFVNKYHPDILDGDYRQYTPEMVAWAKARYLTVWPDGQSATEDEKIWDEAIEKGLNGLQTDHPEAFIKYLKEKGLR